MFTRWAWQALLLAACVAGDAPLGGDKVDPPAGSGLDARPPNRRCVAPERPRSPVSVRLSRPFPSLPAFERPLRMAEPPGDSSRWWIAEQQGVIYSFANDASVATRSRVLDIRGRVDSEPNEAGLLGFAFHPSFGIDGNFMVFVSYTQRVRRDSNGDGEFDLVSTLSRFESTDGGQTLDAGSEEILATVTQPFDNHNGGHCEFGPDGMLYWGLGDGGAANDPFGNGQNSNTVFAKILRLDVTDGSLSIPADNPFVGREGHDAIYASGLRNPWRFHFDSETGELWVGDVGQDTFEEIDRIEAGGNYGWNTREGKHCFMASRCDTTGLIDPVAEYDHSEGVSVTGGFVYRGSAIPSLQGVYLYADFLSGHIWGLFYDRATGEPTPEKLSDSSGLNIPSFAQGHDGELYVLDFATGGVRKFVPDTAEARSSFPELLSQTGCFDPSDPRRPAPGLVPYTVNSPLWSDGAEKDRYMAIPDGTSITVRSDGDFEFPIGTVLAKTFRFGERLLETRLLMRHPDGTWAGYAYEWNEDQTDARLLQAASRITVGDRTWNVPSRANCMQCHSSVAGRALGPEVAQLNGNFEYASTGRTANQLGTLASIGWIDASFANLDSLPELSPLDDETATTEARARSYLHSNCSNCHRPDGPARGNIDFRFRTTLGSTHTCNERPGLGDLGIADARIIKPGDPNRSVLNERVRRRGLDQMPPIASSIVDDEAVTLLDAWVNSLSRCP